MARPIKLIQYALWILIWVLTPHLVWIAIALLIGISIWRWGAPLAWRLIGALMGLWSPREWLSKNLRKNRHMRGSTYDELRFWAWDWVVFALRNGSVLILALIMAALVGPDYIKLLIEMPGKALEALNDPNVPTTLRIFGLAGLIGAPFLVIRAIIAERQAATAADAREDQRLVKAIEQLGAEKTVKVSTDTIDTETTVERDANGEKVKRTVKESRAPTQEVTEDNIEVRIGAVALLEQISRDSARDHWGVMEAFCAYLRNNPPEQEIPPCPVGKDLEVFEFLSFNMPPCYVPNKELEAIDEWRSSLPLLDPVRREILLRISRRPKRRILRDEREYKNPWPRFGRQQPLPLDDVDLRGAKMRGHDLRWANLSGARLEGADLIGARLEGANLSGAHLEGADLRWAHLEGADLSHVCLDGADLSRARLDRARMFYARLERARLHKAYLEGVILFAAHMKGADLREVRLKGANLPEVDLKGANLMGAQLEEAKSMVQAQIDSAFGDSSTTLPPGLTRPDHWPESASWNSWEKWKKSRGFA